MDFVESVYIGYLDHKYIFSYNNNGFFSLHNNNGYGKMIEVGSEKSLGSVEFLGIINDDAYFFDDDNNYLSSISFKNIHTINKTPLIWNSGNVKKLFIYDDSITFFNSKKFYRINL